MRWNETCTLIEKVYSQDDEGVQSAHDVPTEVFCNPQHVGANTWSSMYEIGISIGAKLQVRTVDYSGQSYVRYRGKPYTVEIVEEIGDFTLLTLRHQQSDTDDPEMEQGEDGEGNGG